MKRMVFAVFMSVLILPLLAAADAYTPGSYSSGNSYQSDYGAYKPLPVTKTAAVPKTAAVAVKLTRTAAPKKPAKEESITELRIASEKALEASDKLLVALGKISAFEKNEAPPVTAAANVTPAAVEAVKPVAAETAMPQVSIYGQEFIRYTYQNATLGASPVSAFSIARSYFGVKITGDGYAANFTLDIANALASQKDVDFGAWLKFCFIDFNKLLPGLTLRAGVQKVYFATLDAWSYPLIEASLEDKNKVMGSADQGVAALWEIPAGYGSVEAALYNGAGYKKMEDNTEKLYAVSARLNPFAGSQFKDIYARASYLKMLKNFFGKPAADYSSAAVVMGFKNDLCWGYAEYLVRSDATLASASKSGAAEGVCVFAGAKIWGPFSVNVRFDSWNPDTKAARDEVNTYIAGINYEFNKKTTLQLNWQSDQAKFGGAANYNKIMTQVKLDW